MKILVDSWEAVAIDTIINCFKKAGINSEVQQAAIANLDDVFKDLQEGLNELKSANPSMVSEEITAESLVSIDDDVITTAAEITENDIIEELSLSKETETKKTKTKTATYMQCKNISTNVKKNRQDRKVESALDVLKDTALFSNKGDEMQSLISKFEKIYCAERLNSLRQKDITNFFKTI